METPAKTLGESYEGCLSRDWEKLLDIIESGERRVFISQQEVESDSGPRKLFHIGIANCYRETDGKVISYNIDAMFGPFDRKWVIEWIDRSIVGWFPTKEDEL